MKRKFTISVFSENKTGLLNRVTIIFTRRKINIDSLTVSPSEIPGIYRYTIMINTTRDMAKKIVTQLEKQVEVVKAFFHEDYEIIQQEVALFKISTAALTKGLKMGDLISEIHAQVLTIEPEYIVIEKVGHPQDTQQLYEKLKPYGVLEFARSGSVAITQSIKKLEEFIREKEKQHLF